MPARALSIGLILSMASFLLNGCGHRLPQTEARHPFAFETDRFAFANETVWRYEDGKVVSRPAKPSEQGDRYTRRCFVLCRSALEFWKFARFEPDQKPLCENALAERIGRVRAHGAWKPPLPPEKRIVFPGYANLFELSQAHPEVFKDHLGAGWPTYFRPGNFMIVFPPSRKHQAALNQALQASLSLGHPMVVWLVNFPSLSINHAVLVYKCRKTENEVIYTVYDPNDAESPKCLTYEPETQTFAFQETFYFVGGEVDVRSVYQTPLK